jgi:hypothetical protein
VVRILTSLRTSSYGGAVANRNFAARFGQPEGMLVNLDKCGLVLFYL